MGCSPPGSSVHGISQARILVWIAISFSRDSNQCLLHWQADSLLLAKPPGNQLYLHIYPWASQVAQLERICLPMQETQETVFQPLGGEDPLE